MTPVSTDTLSPEQQDALKIVDSFYDQIPDSKVDVFEDQRGNKFLVCSISSSEIYYYWNKNMGAWAMCKQDTI